MNKADESPVIQVKNVSKDFSGVFALKDVSMSIYPGQVNALIGENGAGKSTLMKILAGIYNDYSGKIIYKGSEIKFSNPRDADKSGISIIHQELNLVSHMSVAENIFLGREPKNRFGFVDYDHMHKTTRQLLGKLNLDIAPDTPVYKLRVGQQQLVEIARVLSFDCQVLIMDEPTSAISDKETDLLFEIITGLRNKGVAIVYISHKIDELFRIADRFVALRDGQYAGEMEMASATPEDMIRMMVGRDNVALQTQQVTERKEEVLRVKGLRMKNLPSQNDICFRMWSLACIREKFWE
jgi:ribose transport system ATP-binding protein